MSLYTNEERQLAQALIPFLEQRRIDPSLTSPPGYAPASLLFRYTNLDRDANQDDDPTAQGGHRPAFHIDSISRNYRGEYVVQLSIPDPEAEARLFRIRAQLAAWRRAQGLPISSRLADYLAMATSHRRADILRTLWQFGKRARRIGWVLIILFASASLELWIRGNANATFRVKAEALILLAGTEASTNRAAALSYAFTETLVEIWQPPYLLLLRALEILTVLVQCAMDYLGATSLHSRARAFFSDIDNKMLEAILPYLYSNREITSG